jgi:type IV pilus assembly protein PilM
MALPFLNSLSRKKRDQIVAVDLGGRTTKTVHLQRRGQRYALCGYALLDAPIFDKTLSADLLAEHLKAVGQALQAKSKFVTMTMGVNDVLVRHAEMPKLPVDDVRLVLKHSSRVYLQQELVSHVFDCHVVANDSHAKPADAPKGPPGPPKQKVLVAAARQQLVDDYVDGAKRAGFVADQIVPGLIGPVNTFELTVPDAFANEVVALVDLGFKNSTISIVQQGELILSRVVAIGGDRLTNGLAESLNISYAEAEGIKVGMPTEVQSQLEALVMPLGRELRASIDFFEHQQDRPVTQVYVTGGSARSALIVQALQQELMIECRILNPTTALQLELPAAQSGEIEQVGPQLTVAVGAALASL